MNRASRTAVWPRLGRRLGMTSRQSSYGVRISVVAVQRDQRVAPRDHFAATLRLHERETAGGGGHGHGDLGETLPPPARRRQRRVHRRRHAEMPQQPGDARQHRIDRRRLPMLTRLHQVGDERRIGRRQIGNNPSAAGRWRGHDRPPPIPACRCPAPAARPSPVEPHSISGSDGHSIECRSSTTSTRVDHRPDLARPLQLDQSTAVRPAPRHPRPG